MMRKRKLLITALFIAMSVTTAAAQDGAKVSLKSEVLRETTVVNDKGQTETRLVPVKNAAPGEVLIFTVTYTNQGTDEARDVVLTNPIPEHMIYEGDSAGGQGAEVTFSVDGGQTFGAAGTLTVRGEDGQKRPAGPDDYTHIRWLLTQPVPAGESGEVSFSARVK